MHHKLKFRSKLKRQNDKNSWNYKTPTYFLKNGRSVLRERFKRISLNKPPKRTAYGENFQSGNPKNMTSRLTYGYSKNLPLRLPEFFVDTRKILWLPRLQKGTIQDSSLKWRHQHCPVLIHLQPLKIWLLNTSLHLFSASTIFLWKYVVFLPLVTGVFLPKANFWACGSLQNVHFINNESCFSVY